MKDSLLRKIKEFPSDNNIYLIEKLSEIAGFFISNQKFLYIVKNSEISINQNIKTDFIELNTNIEIFSVKDFRQFKSGRYNILSFNNLSSENDFESFVNLCKAHVEFMNSENIVNFFYSLMNIFQVTKEQSFKNVIGFLGELIVVKYLYKKLNFDVSSFWHIDGSESKYDFSLPNFNIEVKSTNSLNKLVLIKHNQIFNEDKNILATVFFNSSEQGFSLNDIIYELKTAKNAFKNLNFIMNIEKELKRISENEICNKKFVVEKISFFNVKDINTIKQIPKTISDLQYHLDLSEERDLNFDMLKKIIDENKKE